MVPTFSGRLQARVVTLVAIGLPWTLLVSLPLGPLAAGLGRALRAGLFAWVITLLLGVVLWEPLYHLLMQFRWEKDWPTLFLLTESVPEGLAVWSVVTAIGPRTPWHVFVLWFASTWLVVFGALHGPMRVVFLRWRFRGGRLW